MNRGSIPGYYFDEEKKKYFKVQPHHKAPVDAKYSKANADREQKDSKRRKVQEDERQVLHSQTIVRSRILNDPSIGGSGVLREQGNSSFAQLVSHQGTAIARYLEDSDVHRFDVGRQEQTLCDVHHFPYHIVFAINHGINTVIYIHDRHESGEIFKLASRIRRANQMFVLNEHVVATCSTTISGVPYILGCSSGSGIAQIIHQAIDHANPRYRIWPLSDSINDCTINQKTHDIAFAGGQTIGVRSLVDSKKLCWIKMRYAAEGSAGSAVEWIDANTVAFGTSKSTYGNRQKVTCDHRVALWDIRVDSNRYGDGTSVRFRSRQRVSGIERPDDSGNNLIITTNHSINLYDLRVLKKDRPLLSFDHQSEGMKTYTSIYNGDLLAAIDERQKVQIYSLRSGKHVRTLVPDSFGPMRNVRWVEDSKSSPYLQACCGDTVQTWTLHGKPSDTNLRYE